MLGPSLPDHRAWYQHLILNWLQTALLLAVMAGLLALIGWILWGGEGAFVLLAGSALAVLLAPHISPSWIMRLYGARPLLPTQAPVLHYALVELTRRAELSKVPRLYYFPSHIVNAFAVGNRQCAGIALSDGLLRRLNTREVVAVLAHEVSHVRSNDLKVMALADLLTRMTGIMAWFGWLFLFFSLPLAILADVKINWLILPVLIFAPTLSALAQLGLSRTREYDADLQAARLSGDPEGLARALIKIEQMQGGWIERLFMPRRKTFLASLLRTHPTTEERVKRLMALPPVDPLYQALPVFSIPADIPPWRRRLFWWIRGPWL